MVTRRHELFRYTPSRVAQISAEPSSVILFFDARLAGVSSFLHSFYHPSHHSSSFVLPSVISNFRRVLLFCHLLRHLRNQDIDQSIETNQSDLNVSLARVPQLDRTTTRRLRLCSWPLDHSFHHHHHHHHHCRSSYAEVLKMCRTLHVAYNLEDHYVVSSFLKLVCPSFLQRKSTMWDDSMHLMSMVLVVQPMCLGQRTEDMFRVRACFEWYPTRVTNDGS